MRTSVIWPKNGVMRKRSRGPDRVKPGPFDNIWLKIIPVKDKIKAV